MSANTTNMSAEPGKPELLIAREFDAPRELVFQAFTDPTLYVQWFGPRRFIMTLVTFEPKNGGKWRYDISTRIKTAMRMHFTACITKFLHRSSLLAPLSLKGCQKR